MPLENRTAVISGAGEGLGQVVARELAARGSNLALLGRNPAQLAALGEGLGVPSARLLSYALNLLDADEARRAAEAVAARFGRVDILLHLVGGWTGGKTLLEAAPAELQAMLDAHVWTSFNAVRAFLPHLLRNAWGRIVMISSPFAARPAARGGPYAIAKAGQEALIMTLAQELRGSGVTANVLEVRTIDVDHQKAAHPSRDNAAWSTPEEIAAAAIYLLSDEADAVNGARLPLFGAMH